MAPVALSISATSIPAVPPGEEEETLFQSKTFSWARAGAIVAFLTLNF